MNLDSIYAELKQRNESSLNHTTEELRQIRTGKATPSLVENVEVLAYEGTAKMRLQELASIATDGATSIVIDPYDASVVEDIEKALRSSTMGFNPNVDGKILRINIPPLTEEQREKFIKLAGEKIESARIHTRQHRDQARKSVKSLIDNKDITEDDKFRAEKEIDTITKDFNDKLDDLKQRKINEITSI